MNDPEYPKLFAIARKQAIDSLEDEAIRRGYEGSDVLLIFLLKGAKPDVYRERYDATLRGSGPNGEIEINASLSAREIVLGRMAGIAERRRALESGERADGVAV